ncbi:hypothetical protein AAIH58_37355 [Pseudomonas aeruginosa]
MSQNTQQDSRPIVEVVDLPEFSVEHSTEFLTGSAPWVARTSASPLCSTA